MSGGGTATFGALLLAIVGWGLSHVATRYLLLDRVRAFDVVILRYSIASCLFVPVLFRLPRAAWRRAELGSMAACGLLGVAGFSVPVTLGTQSVPAGTAGLLVTTESMWISLISVAVLGERLGWGLPVGLLLASGGVVALAGGPGTVGLVPGGAARGAGLVLLGAFSWAVYAVAVRPYTRKYGSAASTGLTLMLGTIPLLAGWTPGLAERSTHIGGGAWGALLFLGGVASVFSTVFWNYGSARTSSARAGPWLYLIPLVSVLGGHLLLGEPIRPTTVLGGALIVAGVGITQLHPRGRGAEAVGPGEGDDRPAGDA
ncbi:MAG TPA: DMT family transporter [bacterium]|nr:DMT family transporter [bacterium]